MGRGQTERASTLLFGARRSAARAFTIEQHTESFIAAMIGDRARAGNPVHRVEAAEVADMRYFAGAVRTELPSIFTALQLTDIRNSKQPGSAEQTADLRWMAEQLARLASWAPERLEVGMRPHLGQLNADTKSSFGAAPDRSVLNEALLADSVLVLMNPHLVTGKPGDSANSITSPEGVEHWWQQLQQGIFTNEQPAWANLAFKKLKADDHLGKLTKTIHPADQLRLQHLIEHLDTKGRARVQRSQLLTPDGQLRPTRRQAIESLNAWYEQWLAGQPIEKCERRAGNRLFRELKSSLS